MPGGRQNPFKVSNMIQSLGAAVEEVRDKGHGKKGDMVAKINEMGIPIPFVDLSIQFIGASGLPKMDVVGSADPYFVAKIDGRISFVSTVKQDTLAPVWNEVWRVNNVPKTADLVIKFLDKDEGSLTDDFIGSVKTSVSHGAKELEIESALLKRTRGTFWLKIDSTSASDQRPSEHPYLFDGPVRFSRHFSPTVGKFTNLDGDGRLYSTWKMYIRGIPLFFGDQYQEWNKNYKAAQSIFQGPRSIAVRSGIQAGHKMLYARTATNGFGIINDAASIQHLLQGGSRTDVAVQRIKPAVYTYIISAEDDSFRFSETGAAFFVDFASKHALHANCAERVRYSGEFHPRPKGGWAAFSEDTPDEAARWQFVIDNNSGTYAPDKALLPTLKALLEYNFPGFEILAYDREDEELTKSVEACRQYALKNRGVKQEELEPHLKEGEESLSRKAFGEAQALEDKLTPSHNQ
ncbi:hypothetical protein D9619_012110 [Psilocybe cf. subviscida]|uniref:C2 domain-containing protein n=1 Tax=Psilocybe cf. subviscida TaxID=2480587 RepID=A0A8H5B7R8_9AGAR|nr:hypothetical protein D9619_012110 [Psilocybe cf. subviscida]